MIPTLHESTSWRASGSHLLRLATEISLIETTRKFLLAYTCLRDVKATQQTLNGGLLQLSRTTRTTITPISQIQPTHWHLLSCILEYLITLTQVGHQDELPATLLLHTARQNKLFYVAIQQAVVLHRFADKCELFKADIQRFLDVVQSTHTKAVGRLWSQNISGEITTQLEQIQQDRHLLLLELTALNPTGNPLALMEFLTEGKPSNLRTNTIVPLVLLIPDIHPSQASYRCLFFRAKRLRLDSYLGGVM